MFFKKGFLPVGFFIGGLLALCEYLKVPHHLPFLGLSLYGIMLLLATQYTTKWPALFGATFIASLMASIPCLWLMDASYTPFSCTLLVVVYVFALNAFHLHYQQAGFKWSYPLLFEVVWDTLIQLFIAFIFTLLCWVILSLAGSLFTITGFTQLDKLLSVNWFQWWATAFFVSGGLFIVVKTRHIVHQIRSILLLICEYLLIPLAITGLLFILLSLITATFKTPALNHETLFLSIGFWSVFFLNGAYRDGQQPLAYGKLTWRCIQLFLLLTPLFTLLALAAITLIDTNNIRQNGFNIGNFARLLNALILLGYNLSYAVLAITTEKLSGKSFQKINIALAWILIGLTLLTTNPWLLKQLPSEKNSPAVATRLPPI